MAIGQYPRRELRFGPVCSHDTLPKFILQGTVDGTGCRCRVIPRKSWRDRPVFAGSRCCALQTTEVDGRPSHLRHLSEYPNDAWASSELVPSSLANLLSSLFQQHS